MPRRQKIKFAHANPVVPATALTHYDVPVLAAGDRNAVEDMDLARHALVDMDELSQLPDRTRERLVADIVDAVRFNRVGIAQGKRGVSDSDVARQVFAADLRSALERAEISVTRWRKIYDNGGPESPYFRLLREVAAVFEIGLPRDLKVLGQR